ncbi:MULTISPECIES: hypothetical protein [unclassified Alteromonas]|uniref:hypothetical protein n=1 Tax=unclassified Alteromonas TaxID=2614992 RepID=UPI0013762DA9|nr:MULTISPECIES: hypothetical protein [unclassified Alteromonas]MDO6477619.1 hypothetical protein [Alteromonas sp. 1_MG-2023]
MSDGFLTRRKQSGTPGASGSGIIRITGSGVPACPCTGYTTWPGHHDTVMVDA